jgi:hypothetical protein
MGSLINPYCTLADVQHEASNIDAADAGALEDMITRASRWIDDYCRRDFLYHDHRTDALEVEPSWVAGQRIYLPWPVISLVEVTLDGIVLDANLYRVESTRGSATGVILRDKDWYAETPRDGVGTGSLKGMPTLIKLKGQFGYAQAATNPTTTPSPDLPSVIVSATAVAAAVFSGLVKREFIGLGGERTTTVLREVPKGTLASISKYVRPLV